MSKFIFVLFSLVVASLSQAQQVTDPVVSEPVVAPVVVDPAFEEVHFAELTKDAVVMAAGAATYKKSCQACHGEKGQGMVGPNLTDKFWIHGAATPFDIYTLIAEGVQKTAMIAWKTKLTPEELMNVSVFVYSMKNTNIPGKAPQGTEVP